MQDHKKTTKTERRASRLSEGSAPRALDYQLTYSGKKSENEILTGPKSSTEPVFSATRQQEGSWRNRLYYGDNLGILRSFLEDPQVCHRVKAVYIDPPFATGSVFESRNGQRAYEDVAVGSAFLEFMRERLIILRELLNNKGSIYLHLDEKMAFPIKIIMDEIFGPTNFRNWITRKKSNPKNFTRKQYGNISDYILFYTKTEKYTWHRAYQPWTDERAAEEYSYIEKETGRYFKKVPIHAPGVRKGETGKPWRGKLPPPGKHWQYPPSVLDELDAKGEIYWSSNGNPRRKIYFDQSQGIPLQNIWLDCKDAHNQNIEVTGYPTEKPIELLQRIIAASSDPGDLILDCFAGSGTTVVAAEELQRRWIGIDSSLEAIATTVQRLAQGSEPMGDYVNGRKKKEPGLFAPPSPLQTAFDLYSEEALPTHLLREWNGFF